MKIDSLYIENFKSIESAQWERIIPVKVPL